MSIKKGCKFCIRHGLPVLPARAAVMSQDDVLPALPSTLTAPLAAQGETAWTARLLREGFLYIWSESGKYWKSYFATADGYYYPLPESGDVPPDIVSGKVKPCITEPSELATASLVTLPVKPAGMKNGLFWFGWSEVEWTDGVRKRHEDAEYRSRYMQRFDMDAWLSSGRAEQAVPIAGLSDTVAEYSAKAANCEMRKWSQASWKRASLLDGKRLGQAAELMSPGKGAIILLADPVAVVQDLSTLSTWRLKTRFADDAHYARGIALSSALSGLKQAMTEQFRRDLQAEDKSGVQISRTIGTRVIAGMPLPPDDPERAAAETRLKNEETFDQRFEQRTSQRWADYEKYIDREQEQAFLTELGAAVKAYGENVITPMTQMYLDGLQSSELINSFIHNYDTDDIQSGLCYLQSVTDCLEGMQDQIPVSQWLHDRLAATSFSADNYVMQALVFNNEKMVKQIQEKVRKAAEVKDVPWDKLMEGIKSATQDYSKIFSLKMEYYINAISSGFIRLIGDVAWSKPALAVVAMVAASGYGLKVVTLTGKRKYFLEGALRTVAQITDIEGRVPLDKLRPRLDKALRRMELDGIPMEDTVKRRFMVLVEVDEAGQLAALPESERIKQVSKVLRSADDITDAVFPRFYRSKMAVLKGTTANHIADMTAGAVPFWGCMASVIFQGIALKGAAGDKELKSWEKGMRFAANVIGAFGSSMELTERALNDLKGLRLKALVRVKMGTEFLKKTMTVLKYGVKYCSRAALVGIVWDATNAFDYLLQGDLGMAGASLISAVSGLLLAGIIPGLVLGPIGIAWSLIFVFGSAIFLAIKGDNDIQKWLKSCLWRKIPEGLYSLPEIYPSGVMEIAAFNDALKPEDK